jgi:hypothetical protein
MTLAAKLAAILHLAEDNTPMNWWADYWVKTPSGSKARFTRSGTVYQLGSGGSASEWAVLAKLREVHHGCDIQINNVKWSG